MTWAIIDVIEGRIIELVNTKKEGLERIRELKILDKWINYKTRYVVEREDKI